MQPTRTTACSQALTGSHATYNVGPGQQYTTLTAVPFTTLQPGDVVNIYYQPTHYFTKIALQAVGTAANPVIINGVTDSNCNRPVIDGNGAVETTDSISSGFWQGSAPATIESFGVIVFIWGPTEAYATLPSYITIQNLEITGGKGTNTFTNHSGATTSYLTDETYAIYGVAASNVTIQYDTLDGNDGGVFFNSQDQARTSYYITLRGNDIFGDGVVGEQLTHNIYVQGYRSLYEGNYIANQIVGATGSSLKDRSSGPVIRNNYIIASARAIDLVDTETSPVVLDDPLYNYGWVYGNVILDNCALNICSADLIHWGGDSQGDQASSPNYHNGPLYFYNNTVIVENSPGTFARFGIFDMPSSQQSVDAAENIIWFNNNAANDVFELGICCGTINLQDDNWLSSGYVASGESANTVVLNQQGTAITGTSPLLNSDFTLSATSGSPVIGAGGSFPASVPTSAVSLANLQATGQYANSFIGIVARPNTHDLGAYAAH